MAYVLLDDQIAAHPKVLRAGAEAAWLWACAIAYCNRQLTDGVVPAEALATMGSFRVAPVKLATRLVEVGLFERDGVDYRVHDYLNHNPDKATVEERRAAATERKALSRARKGQRDPAAPVHHWDANVTHVSQRDISVTAVSSRASRTNSNSNSTSTDAESASVDAREPQATHLAVLEVVALWNVAVKESPVDAGTMTPKGQRRISDMLGLRSVDQLAAVFQRVGRSAYATGRDGQHEPLTLWRALDHLDQIEAGDFDDRRKSGPVRVAGLAGGGTTPRARGTVAVIDPDYHGAEYRFHCSHTPTCSTWPQCRAALMADEARTA